MRWRTDESFETDTPGLRIRCEAASWRVVATHLLPRMAPNQPITVVSQSACESRDQY